MELNSSTFLRLFDFKPKGQDVSLGDLVKKIAQETPLCSATSEPLQWTWRGRSIKEKYLNSPLDCECLVVATILVNPGWSNYSAVEVLFNSIYRAAAYRGFEGSWEKVGKIFSQQNFKSLHGVFKIVLEERSENDFYGNFLPNVHRILRNIPIKLVIQDLRWKDPVLVKKDIFYRPPKRKVRRRGYNDKGSRRLSHEIHTGGTDIELLEKESKRLEKLEKFKQQEPPPRYWYGTQYPPPGYKKRYRIGRSSHID